MRSLRPVAPRRLVLIPLCASFFVVQMGLSVADVPFTMVVQDILCRERFGAAPSPGQCLDADVQRALNMVTVGMAISVTVAGALVSIPYGFLADRIGRIPVLTMSILGILLNRGFSIYVLSRNGQVTTKALWGQGVPLLLGGGRPIAEATVFTIISDTAAASRRANYFQWLAGAVLLGQLSGLLLAQPLLDRFRSPWVPIGLSPGLVALGGIAVVLFVPETLPHGRRLKFSGLTSNTMSNTMSIIPRPPPPPPSRSTTKLLCRKPAVFLFPGAALAIPVATMQSEIILRFMPVQFGWSLPQSGLLLSLRTLLTMLTLVAILPGLSWLISKWSSWPPMRREKALARASACLFVLGSLGLLMVKNTALVVAGFGVSALGSGIPTLCRSMLVVAVRGCNVGVVFGILAGTEVLGSLACQLGMGWLFDVGLVSWPGLPFAMALLLAVVIGITIWMARVSAPTEELLEGGEMQRLV